MPICDRNNISDAVDRGTLNARHVGCQIESPDKVNSLHLDFLHTCPRHPRQALPGGGRNDHPGGSRSRAGRSPDRWTGHPKSGNALLSNREECYHRKRHRRPRREDLRNGTMAEATRGELDRALPAGHRADLLRGLHLTGVLRARARRHLQAGLAERRPGRAAAAQRAATSPRSWPWRAPPSSSCAATTARSGPSTTSAATAATSWSGGTTPSEETSGICRQFVCKYHGWRYDLDGSCTSCNRSRSSSTSTRRTTAWSRCTATCGPGSSSSTWPRSRSRTCATSSDRW